MRHGWRSNLGGWLGLSLLAVNLSAASGPESAERVLADAKAASGGAAWDAVRSVTLTAHVETSGLAGDVQSVTDATTGRYADTYRLGPVGGGEGFDGKTAWIMDSSGLAHAQDGDGTQGALSEAYRRAYGYWFPARRSGTVEALGERRDGERTFDVVRCNPAGGRAFELWIDRATHRIDRTVETSVTETRTTFFSDYRAVAGVMVPYAQRSTNGDARYDQTIVLTGVEVNAAGAEQASFAMPAVVVADAAIVGGAPSTTVAFELINNHVYVRAELDGHPVRLLCDTGGFNLLRPEAAKRLGLTVEGAVQTRGVGEATEEAGYVRVKEVRLGDAEVEDQAFAVMDLSRIADAEGVDFDGLLGHELFKRFVTRIDYPASRLTLTRPASFSPPAGATALPFTLDDSTPQIDGALDGIAGRFDLDTGSRATLDVLRPFVEAHGLRAKYAPKIEGATGFGIGGPSRSQVARAGRLELGTGERTVAIAAPVVNLSLQTKGSFADPTIAGNIGGGLLKAFAVTFDYGHALVYFEPSPAVSGTAQDGDFDRAGVWMNRAGDAFVVVDVYRGSPAEEAGLRAGDRILAVAGKSAAEQPLPEVRRALRVATAPVELTIERGGSRRTISVRPRRLV